MEKKVIIITGSSRGIGRGLAEYFLSKGHFLVINGRNQQNLYSTLDELKKKGEVVGMAGDSSLESTHHSLLELGMKSFGKVDIYINNAGIPQGHRSFIDLDSKNIRDLVNVNILGLMLGTKTAARFMLEQGFGKIFNMEGFGSDGRILDKLTLYGTSKRAVQYFTKSMANELKKSCVQIGSINPGMVNTDFIKVSMKQGSESEMKQFEKVKRIMAEEPETVVPVIAQRILQSKKHYDRINYLTGFKLFVKIFRLITS